MHQIQRAFISNYLSIYQFHWIKRNIENNSESFYSLFAFFSVFFSRRPADNKCVAMATDRLDVNIDTQSARAPQRLSRRWKNGKSKNTHRTQAVHRKSSTFNWNIIYLLGFGTPKAEALIWFDSRRRCTLQSINKKKIDNWTFDILTVGTCINIHFNTFVRLAWTKKKEAEIVREFVSIALVENKIQAYFHSFQGHVIPNHYPSLPHPSKK